MGRFVCSAIRRLLTPSPPISESVPDVSPQESPDVSSRESLASTIDYGRLLRWIKTCDSRHTATCITIPAADRPHQIPEWVIDTQDACIVPGRTATRYVALSYRWADALSESERLMLRRSNLAEFQQPGFLSEGVASRLPQVIRDTIDLIKKLDERFLWIDRLCIIQGDEQTRFQAEQMDEVYSGAYFTVIAAASSGLYGQGHSRQASSDSRLPRHSPLEALAEYHYSRLLKSKWAERGWTFQEQILSKRSILFLDHEVFWDCQHALWDEYKLDPDLAGSPNSYVTPYNEMARRLQSNSWPDFSLYIELVCLYNSRQLTDPGDALSAFSGILNRLGRSYPGGFVSGMPRLFLDAALLWQPFSRPERRTQENGGITPIRHLPSWSWCGWRCVVDPWSLRSGLAYIDREDTLPTCGSASTWRTENLVHWSVLSKDMTKKQILPEPSLLETYKSLLQGEGTNLPDGWSRRRKWLRVFFNHKSDPDTRFQHPVPTVQTPTDVPNQETWPFLVGEITRAMLRVRSILRPKDAIHAEAAPKISVFKLRQFTEGPDDIDDICSVVCLQDHRCRWAGILRLMGDDEIHVGADIELIAISSGSVAVSDLESSYEERIEKDGFWTYRGGLTGIFFDRSPSRSGSLLPLVSLGNPLNGAKGNEIYQFYNVLWIERKDGVAYRKAAGRVPKTIWEANCSSPARVVLG
ncbi:heterokaryon incompatibility protein-domain-containing protein [Dactylonectria estremocensis]|uniref:Heterokaryon incompatibility protein-domain-containing protein n=1 Tax=Dactylonectria estremocensis TaxID=1079267 RepID=A0A9P9EUD2_9HYPO|nr:heterokaryon incompatibility protein-domain-containing protein [Dactylonectria estremocensis]